MYESASNIWISLDLSFFQHGFFYFEPARAYYICMISSLLTYLHILSVFHNQRPCKGYRELYSGRNIDFTLKNHCPARPLFCFFGVAVRFDWIKIDVWLKLGVLNYSSRPKFSLGSAHVKYGVWLEPNSRFCPHYPECRYRGLYIDQRGPQSQFIAELPSTHQNTLGCNTRRRKRSSYAKKPKYGTAGYENPKPLWKKGNVYPHLLNSAAVPPSLGAQVRKKDNKHKISRKQITQN